MQQLISTFLEYLSFEKKYSKHTVTAYKTDLENFVHFTHSEFEINTWKEVNYPIIRNWIVNLVNQQQTNRTINRKISSLKSFFKYLQKIEELQINPLNKHKALKSKVQVQIPFSKQELESVLQIDENKNDFEAIRNQLLILLLYTTGMRKSEIINLKLSDVNIESNTIKILGKRNKERYVPILTSSYSLLQKYLSERNKIKSQNLYFFVTSQGNKIYNSLVYRIINVYFSKVSSKDKKSPHILRHTFATHILNEGANLNSVKELLGHSSLASTQVYTHNSLEKLKNVYNQAHPKSQKK